MARVEYRSPGRMEHRSLGNEIRCNRLVDGIGPVRAGAAFERQSQATGRALGGNASKTSVRASNRPGAQSRKRGCDRGEPVHAAGAGCDGRQVGEAQESSRHSVCDAMTACGQSTLPRQARDASAAAPASGPSRESRAASPDAACLGRVAVPRQCFGAEERRPPSQTVTRPRAGSSVRFGGRRADVGRRNVRGAAAAVTQCCAVGEENLRGVLASHGAARVSSRRRGSVDGAFGSHRAVSDARDTAHGRLSPRGDGRTGSASHRPRRSVPRNPPRHRHSVPTTGCDEATGSALPSASHVFGRSGSPSGARV
jgi:hypothetical protein